MNLKDFMLNEIRQSHAYPHTLTVLYDPTLLFFRGSVMSYSLWPHGLQHTRLPCPSPSPRTFSNSCPLSQWCHPTVSSSHPLLILPSIFPSKMVFSNESALSSRWPKYWFHLSEETWSSQNYKDRKCNDGTSLVVWWLRICLPVQGDTGSIPGLVRSHMLWNN